MHFMLSILQVLINKKMSVMFHILTNEETQDLRLQLHLELPGSAKVRKLP